MTNINFSFLFMTSFFQSGPIFRTKSLDTSRKKHEGAIYLPVFSPFGVLPSSYYTRIDQALLVWGTTVALIFIPAQFLYVDWQIQAILWSALSSLAVVTTYRLTWSSENYRHLRWVMQLWSWLVLFGVGVSNYGIFGVQGWILGHLCDVWLGICGIGYFICAVGMRSRPLAIIGGIHSLTIVFISAVPQWMFLTTGLVMSCSLLLLAELWWEHR
ncbi:MAG: hypothetical protein AAGD25_36300 [Cyanobacteria bacterium P01_F01_bin.150]